MMSLKNINEKACQVCRKESLNLISEFESISRITSDCRPFGMGGKLAVCMHCGAVQKIVDHKWLNEITEIYSGYNSYPIAKGEEQLVMDPVNGMPKKRSVVLMEQLREVCQFNNNTKILDVGCGNGVTLKVMSEFFPEWELFGFELESNKLNELKGISGFKDLFTKDLDKINQSFDFATMMHSLEHFVQPLETLKSLRKIISDTGHIFVEVCNVDENPFDLLVADHLMHFSPNSMLNVMRRAGFDCSNATTSWVKKEISFLGIPSQHTQPMELLNPEDVLVKMRSYITWLLKLQEDAKSVSNSCASFGIFGTSIAASWLAAALGDKVQFFVDEDPNRIGREYMNKPIYSPADVPESSLVYLALAPVLASKIADRMKRYPWSMAGVTM